MLVGEVKYVDESKALIKDRSIKFHALDFKKIIMFLLQLLAINISAFRLLLIIFASIASYTIEYSIIGFNRVVF